MNRHLAHITLLLCLLGSSSYATAQTYSVVGGDGSFNSGDSLALRQEWWVGANISGFFQQNFGKLSVQYVGSEAPGSARLYANTEGGNGYGAGAGPLIEYRPFRSRLAYGLMLAGEVRTMRSESSEPIANDIYAFNAIFETNATAWYVTVAPFIRYQMNVSGAYVLGGVTVDVPVAVTNSYVWQHELPNGEAPGTESGRPMTSIKFKTEVDMGVRIGMQLGFGHDFMLGLFGYKNQLISPYFVVQGGTPIVSLPTAFNGFAVRVGVLWKYGI